MFHIILYQPEIPPNTGNIIRLSANTGCSLQLIHPLRFTWDDKRLQRAGLDYHEFAQIHHHATAQACFEQLKSSRIFVLTSKASTIFSEPEFKSGDAFLFGSETSGLPKQIHDNFSSAQKLVIPQKPNSRTLNLSNSAAIMVYEAWRQCHYCDS